MQQKKFIWLGMIVLTGLFIFSVREILFPFVIGILLGYLLDPTADWLETLKVSRTNATLIIISGFFCLFGIASYLLMPLLLEQLVGFVENIPSYSHYFFKELLPSIQYKIGQVDSELVDRAEKVSDDIIQETGSNLGQFVTSLLDSGLWLLNLISLIVITPVITFYMLRDWDKFVARCDSLLPLEYADDIRELAVRIDEVLSGFIRGQLNVCLLLGLFYAVGLTLTDLNYGFLVGFGAGLLAFIPYVGTIAGVFIGFGMAYVQFEGAWLPIVNVMSVFVLGQVLEGNFITPKLVGDNVKLHPAWLIFGMLSGGVLLGTVGVLLAVPLTAIIGVVVRFLLERYDKMADRPKSDSPHG